MSRHLASPGTDGDGAPPAKRTRNSTDSRTAQCKYCPPYLGKSKCSKCAKLLREMVEDYLRRHAAHPALDAERFVNFVSQDWKPRYPCNALGGEDCRCRGCALGRMIQDLRCEDSIKCLFRTDYRHGLRGRLADELHDLRDLPRTLGLPDLVVLERMINNLLNEYSKCGSKACRGTCPVCSERKRLVTELQATPWEVNRFAVPPSISMLDSLAQALKAPAEKDIEAAAAGLLFMQHASSSFSPTSGRVLLVCEPEPQLHQQAAAPLHDDSEETDAAGTSAATTLGDLTDVQAMSPISASSVASSGGGGFRDGQSPRSVGSLASNQSDEVMTTLSARQQQPDGCASDCDRRCEMRHCTTNGPKRRGVPYCGTCRKFIEETVRWYIQRYNHHPSGNVEQYLYEVRYVRLACSQRTISKCTCKMCKSHARFNELMVYCKDHLNVFLRDKNGTEADAAAAADAISATTALSDVQAADRLSSILRQLEEIKPLLAQLKPEVRATFLARLQATSAALTADGQHYCI